MKFLFIFALALLLAMMLSWAHERRLGRGIQALLWGLSVLAAFVIGFTD